MTATKIQGRFVHVTPQGKSFKDVLEIDNDEGVNDIHIYTYPVSMWVDTPNMNHVKVTKKDPSGDASKDQTIKQEGGLSQGFLNDVSSFGVQHIKPALKKGDKIEIELRFDDTFDEDEGYVIYLTQDGKTLTPSKQEMKVRVPTGPTTFDVLVEAAKLAGTVAKPLISKLENSPRDAEKAAAMLLSGKISDKPKQSLLVEADLIKKKTKG